MPIIGILRVRYMQKGSVFVGTWTCVQCCLKSKGDYFEEWRQGVSTFFNSCNAYLAPPFLLHNLHNFMQCCNFFPSFHLALASSLCFPATCELRFQPLHLWAEYNLQHPTPTSTFEMQGLSGNMVHAWSLINNLSSVYMHVYMYMCRDVSC